MRNIPLKQFLADFSSQDNFVFLDTNRFDKTNRFSYLFTKPLDVISCYDTDLVERSIKKINRMLDKGYFAAGFVSYEAGFALEEVFTKNRAYDFPLLWRPSRSVRLGRRKRNPLFQVIASSIRPPDLDEHHENLQSRQWFSRS